MNSLSQKINVAATLEQAESLFLALHNRAESNLISVKPLCISISGSTPIIVDDCVYGNHLDLDIVLNALQVSPPSP